MYIGFLIVLVASFSVFTQQSIRVAEGWLGILPIATNRLEAEAKFKVAPSIRGNWAFYEAEEAVFSVAYSSEPCSSSDFGKWRVPKDTILSYSIGFKKQPSRNSLRIDPSRFTRREYPESSSVKYYSKQDRISIDAELDEGREFITTIFFYPAKRFEKLRCKTFGTTTGATR
jgi:hypothetical protein